jgi:hypothetical protein
VRCDCVPIAVEDRQIGIPRHPRGRNKMKRNVFTIVAAAVAICAFSCSAFAQSDMHLRAAIPFQFVAEGKVLKPGVYDVQELEPSIIVLRNMKDHSAAVAPTIRCRPEKGAEGKTTLVFHRYSNTHFLAQVTLANSNEAQQLPISPKEEKLAHARTRPELVLVSLSTQPLSLGGQ